MSYDASCETVITACAESSTVSALAPSTPALALSHPSGCGATARSPSTSAVPAGSATRLLTQLSSTSSTCTCVQQETVAVAAGQAYEGGVRCVLGGGCCCCVCAVVCTSHSARERICSSRTPSHEPLSTTRPAVGEITRWSRPPMIDST